MYDIGCNATSGETDNDGRDSPNLTGIDDDGDGEDSVTGRKGRRRRSRQRALLAGLDRVKRRILSMTPAGQAALAVNDNRRRVRDPKAARVLAKAKRGDRKEQARIRLIQKRAAKGDRKAKIALMRLQRANGPRNFIQRGGLTLARWYRRGIS